MKHGKSIKAVTLASVLLFTAVISGCAQLQQAAAPKQSIVPTEQQQPSVEAAPTPAPDAVSIAGEYAPTISEIDKDDSWSLETATRIMLSDTDSSVTGSGAAAVDGGIKISEAGTYVLSGEMKDGRVVVSVDSDEPTVIVLNGVHITCSTSAPMNFANGDVKLILAEGTQNTLIDSAAYQFADETIKEPNACLYADDNMTITGNGALSINANFNNGIGSKDELRISSGKLTIHAKNNALKGNDCVLISGGEINIQSDGDGIKSDNEKEEGKGYIAIEGGEFTVVVLDDALQATSAVIVNGGHLSTRADGKRINCDGALSIAAGCIE